MDFDHWHLGEAVQDRLAEVGASSDGSAGIAVDLHDLLQAADRIRVELAPAILANPSAEAVQALRSELDHIAWHVATASEFLGRATID